MRRAGVRGKIILNSALVLLIVASAVLYAGLASVGLARSVEILFRNNRLMEDIRDSLGRTEASLTVYLSTKSSDALKDYIKYSTRLSEDARRLNREIRADEVLLLERDLAGLLDSFLADAEASVASKRGRDVAAYTERFESAERTLDLVMFLIDRIEGVFISDSLAAFSGFNSRVTSVLVSNAVLVVFATLMGMAILVSFSFRLTEPLAELARAAEALGRGDYDHDLPPPGRPDEIGVMAASFASMRESVRRAFEEQRAKAELERSLMEERVRLLDMDHKLKDAELLALQTQINPHFLFNTLAAGQQLALSEGADRTGDFMENLAAFIRYALKPPSRSVRVSDELECVRLYIWLLRLRFGERYRFEVEADDRALSVETPALVLQPLVENAVGHGLRDREEGGTVRVSARVEGREAVLSVEDSGGGMSPAERERILGEPAGEGDPRAGIGLRNVIRRVTLATEGRGRVDVESSEGAGTAVRIRLPLEGVVP
ncbi:MAG TPA: histidine kinase [Spirochaetia bacterium]|nr:histidine kinase [Spirochaetales bacterium]HRY79844.1 histidine kinase [Spirochaetia bacterium]HRZ88003.1 histidine kinase [Spirochaetia bacterium]